MDRAFLQRLCRSFFTIFLMKVKSARLGGDCIQSDGVSFSAHAVQFSYRNENSLDKHP